MLKLAQTQSMLLLSEVGVVATTQAMTYSKKLLFNALVAILEERPNTRLSEISRRLRVGRHTLERVVQDLQGCSFTEYRHCLLVATAAELLSNSELSVKGMAFSLDYQNASSFSRFVRNKTGNRPTEIRAACSVEDE